MAVDLGAVAPDFELTDTEGALVRLADQRARGPVVLVFNRGFA
jgi:peroxiredoxin